MRITIIIYENKSYCTIFLKGIFLSFTAKTVHANYILLYMILILISMQTGIEMNPWAVSFKQNLQIFYSLYNSLDVIFYRSIFETRCKGHSIFQRQCKIPAKYCHLQQLSCRKLPNSVTLYELQTQVQVLVPAT